MSDIKYIYYFNDTSSWFLNKGFCIYTEKEVGDYLSNNKHIEFTRLGYDTDMTDLSYAMYLKMHYDIINEDSYRDNNEVCMDNHSHVAIMSTVTP